MANFNTEVGLNPKYHKKFRKIIKFYNLQEQVSFLGFIDDKKLLDLYSNARGFVFPSKSEGFGIPIIESMSTGTPVACSQTSCMPEIGSDCVTYFDPNSIEDISKCLMNLWEQNQNIKDKASKAVSRARDFYPSLYKSSLNELMKILNEK